MKIGWLDGEVGVKMSVRLDGRMGERVDERVGRQLYKDR